MSAIPEWKRREDHETETRSIFQRLGFLNSRGEVVNFNGARFWEEMEKVGHTSVRLEDCICWRAR